MSERGEPQALADTPPRRRAVLEQKNLVTARISETVRYIGFGLLAIFYALVTSDSAFAITISSQSARELRFIAMLGIATVALDYLQYAFARAVAVRALDRIDLPNEYDPDSFAYIAREVCFWGKQGTVILGCLFLAAGAHDLTPSTH